MGRSPPQRWVVSAAARQEPVLIARMHLQVHAAPECPGGGQGHASSAFLLLLLHAMYVQPRFNMCTTEIQGRS